MPEPIFTAVYPEPCPLPFNFSMEGCQDSAVISANDTLISGLGRIVQVDATIKNVCPGKQLAVAIILSEVDQAGEEHPRGTKTLLIPAQGGTDCRDLQLKCISFVVPEALSAGAADSICSPRNFRTRILANYIDTDFACCEPQTVTV